ncbi:MAG TPA: class I adenylate-forming enzyme family protein [Candidatus Dormibacteraeota bacterium]
MTATTFHAALADACARWRDRPAITHGDATMTYGELAARISTLARTYQRVGIGRGDRVLCQLGNCPEHVISLGAAWAVSAIHVGVDHAATARELEWLVDHTDASAVLLQPRTGNLDNTGELVRRLRARRPALTVFVLDDRHVRALAGIISLSDLTTASSDRALLPASIAPAPEDTAMLLFTSGTTGTPKGSMADHASFLEGWQATAAMLNLGPDDIHLVHLPLAHAFGLSMAVMALLSGGRVILEESFSSEASLRRISTDRVSIISGAPAHYILLLRDLDPDLHDGSSLRAGVGSASTFTPEQLAEMFERLGIEFLLMYGSSEGVGVLTTDREDMLCGSVGRPAPNEVRIVADDGTPLPAGDVGEIAFNRTIAPVRHWGEESPRADGYAGSRPGDGGSWYYSGDLGRIDAAGRLHVMGRIKHLIDRGGLKVDPTEVTAAVLRCAGVADAAVIGTPNPVLGENICACVVPAASATVSLSDLRHRLAADLAHHKLPDELCVLAAIPRTAVGKVDLDALRAAVADRQRASTHAH